MKIAHSNLLYSNDQRLEVDGGSHILLSKTFNHSLYIQKGYPFGKSIRGLKKFIKNRSHNFYLFASSSYDTLVYLGGSEHGGGYDEKGFYTYSD